MNWIQKSLKTKTGKAAAIGFVISTAVLALEFGRDMAKTFDLSEIQQQRLELTLGFLSKTLTGAAIVTHGGAGMMRVASKKGIAVDENNDGIPDHLQRLAMKQTTAEVKIDRLTEKLDAIVPMPSKIEMIAVAKDETPQIPEKENQYLI